ncbi:GNAT family N-acetyltransferase [Desulfosporosinus nitroreducens]|uniref:GNAT family N-acetyltransferase n=1 Tax=Desulfosporosinus nitroreducens TaxID=2018668 RepID=UPI00207CA3D2|nr:GNAT family N-acetyltransferase [Desulfosporosinus nitroreducens]MCO1603339.1 acetyltransferase [Desulfosporosinus nitroreducens]
MDSGDLNIRKVKNVDIPLFEEWLNKEHIRKWFGDLSEWLNEIYNREGQYYWINHYIIEYEDRPIGFCQYYDCGKTDEGYAWDNEPESTFGIDYLIGNEHFLGKGIGNQIVKKLTQMIIYKENPAQIIADPVKDNIASSKVLEYNSYFFDDYTGLYKLKL